MKKYATHQVYIQNNVNLRKTTVTAVQIHEMQNKIFLSIIYCVVTIFIVGAKQDCYSFNLTLHWIWFSYILWILLEYICCVYLLNYIAAIYIHLVNDISINSSTAFLDVIYYIMNYKDIKLFHWLLQANLVVWLGWWNRWNDRLCTVPAQIVLQKM